MTQKHIDGFGTVDVGPFPPLRGLQVRARVAKALVPALAKAGPLLEQLKPGNNLADIEIEKAGPLLGAMLAELNPDELPELVKALLATTSVIVTEGKKQRKVDLCTPGAIDSTFEGQDHVLLFDVIPFALKEVFAGFLTGIVSADEPTTPTL